MRVSGYNNSDSYICDTVSYVNVMLINCFQELLLPLSARLAALRSQISPFQLSLLQLWSRSFETLLIQFGKYSLFLPLHQYGLSWKQPNILVSDSTVKDNNNKTRNEKYFIKLLGTLLRFILFSGKFKIPEGLKVQNTRGSS